MYTYYRRGTPVGLAQSAFTLWMEGKVLVSDTLSVVAWFVDEEHAKEFCDFMNSKTPNSALTSLKTAINAIKD